MLIACGYVPPQKENHEKSTGEVVSVSDSEESGLSSCAYDTEPQENLPNESVDISQKPQIITPILDPTIHIDGYSVKIGNKKYYAKYKDEYVQRGQEMDTDRFFEFYYEEEGKEFKLDIPISVSYINRSFQNFPVVPYPNSILSNALAIETTFGRIVITADISNYEQVEGADSYNYYLVFDNGELLRLNNNFQNHEIAFSGTANFDFREIFYLQSAPGAKNRSLYSVDLSSRICKELLSDVAEYALADNIFFTKYNAAVPETISNEFRGNVGVGLYEYDREDSSVYEILPSSEYIITGFIASEDHLFINAYEYENEGSHSKSILFDRKSETFMEFDQTFLFPVFAEEGVLCSLDYSHSKQALISYDGEVAIWEN